MTLLRPSLDYTAKDFDSLRDRLFNVIPSAFPDWTDTQIADFGNILVELFAYVGDTMLFYQDNQAQESRWSTAILKRSILSMVKMIRYRPTGAAASTVQLIVRLAAPPAGFVLINPGDVFTTLDASSPLSFQALGSATIAAGANPAVAYVTVENSRPAQDLWTSSGLPNQEYQLTESPFLDSSLVITAEDGTYTLVDDFLSSTATDKHATLEIDENSRGHLTFGNAVSGSIPKGTVILDYKTGGGSVGNVAKNTIRKATKNYTDNLGNMVQLSVTNPANATGGAEAQTVESIRELAPRSLRAPTRTVCREDYEINALRVQGVARALMLSRDEYLPIQENQGALYIVPKGGGYATEALLSAVYTMVHATYPKTITFKVAVLSASYLIVDVVTKVHFAKGYKPADVAKQIRANLASFFSITADDGSRNDAIDFGFYLDEAIAWSDVFNIIRDTPGVRKIDDGLGNLTLNGEADDLSVPPQKFPQLGTVTIIDALSGLSL